MPAPYPKEIRDDVVRVAERREPGVTIAQVAKDFGTGEECRCRATSRWSSTARGRALPADAAELLDGYSGAWWIGGGWAIDVALDHARPHGDIDIVIPRSELSLLRGWLGGKW